MIRHIKRSHLLLSTALGIGIFAPAVAWAQTPGSGESSVQQIEQVVVTARRVEERLQDVPISISVFNQKQLTKQNVVNPQDLAAVTPSLSANTNFGSQNTTFSIRGFVQEIGTAPSVGIYFADVVSPRGASNGQPTGDGIAQGTLFDLQNVQVLKGPQGTLFGINTTGGSILIVPKRPTSEFGGYVQGSLGNYNEKGVEAVINIPINDKILTRFGINHESRDGYLINTSGVGPRNFDDVNYTAVRASAVVNITPNLENYTIFTYNNSDTHGDFQKLVAADPAAAPASATLVSPFAHWSYNQLADNAGRGFYDAQQLLSNPYSKVTQWQVINTTTWNATDNLTFKNIASYAQFEDTLNSELFGAFWTPVAGLPFGFAQSSPPPNKPSAHEATITEEFRVLGRAWGDRLTYQGGTYFEFVRPLENGVGAQSPNFMNCVNSQTLQCTDGPNAAIAQYLGFPPAFIPAIGFVNVTTGETSYRDIGIYAQATFAITSKLKITGGARYTWDHESNDSYQTSISFLPGPSGLRTVPGTPQCSYSDAIPTGCNRHFSLRSHAPTGMVDFEYTPTENYLFYAKYSRGYRTGVINPNLVGQLAYTKPEQVDTFEVGAKTTFNGRIPGTLDIAGFDNEFSNQQVQVGFNQDPTAATKAPSTAAPLNIGKSRIWGFELAGHVFPFEGLQVDVGYTYLNAKIIDVAPVVLPAGAPYIVSGQPLPGYTLPLTPRNKFTIGATYTLPLNKSIGAVSIGALFAHTDKMVSNYADGSAAWSARFADIQATNLLNLNLTWSSIYGKPVDLLLFATNVTGQKYYTYSPGLGGSASPLGFETAAVGAPTMFGARLTYHFGADN